MAEDKIGAKARRRLEGSATRLSPSLRLIFEKEEEL